MHPYVLGEISLSIGRVNKDLKTGCPIVAIVKSLGVLFFKGDPTVFILQP